MEIKRIKSGSDDIFHEKERARMRLISEVQSSSRSGAEIARERFKKFKSRYAKAKISFD